jgi:hypothetical protein
VAMGRRGDDDGDGLVDQTLVAWRMGMRAAGDFGRGGCTHYLDSAQIVASAPSHIHSIGATGPFAPPVGVELAGIAWRDACSRYKTEGRRGSGLAALSADGRAFAWYAVSPLFLPPRSLRPPRGTDDCLSLRCCAYHGPACGTWP